MKQVEQGQRAYAKIVSENNREFYITEESKLDIDIGREKKNPLDPNYFTLAEQNTISKKHANIFWDEAKQSFFIKNLSKNKVSIFK